MLIDIFKGFDPSNPLPTILEFVQILIIVMIALTFHEVAHGLVAKWLGDDTASRQGRLSLNPIHHLDPIGFLCMLVAGFGWAKPVEINTRRFKNPKVGMAISALAGPVMNLLLAIVGWAILETCVYFVSDAVYMAYIGFLPVTSDISFSVNLFTAAVGFLDLFAVLNISLAIFNFIPVPPLDGSRVLYAVLPDKYYFGVMKYEQYISMALMLLLIVGALDKPLSIAVNGVLIFIDFIVPII